MKGNEVEVVLLHDLILRICVILILIIEEDFQVGHFYWMIWKPLQSKVHKGNILERKWEKSAISTLLSIRWTMKNTVQIRPTRNKKKDQKLKLK